MFNFLSCLPPLAARPCSSCSSRRSSASSRSSSHDPLGCACSCSLTPPSLFAASLNNQLKQSLISHGVFVKVHGQWSFTMTHGLIYSASIPVRLVLFSAIFCCPQDSSFRDLVINWCQSWLTPPHFWKTLLQSTRTDLCSLRHVIRVMRRHDLTNK